MTPPASVPPRHVRRLGLREQGSRLSARPTRERATAHASPNATPAPAQAQTPVSQPATRNSQPATTCRGAHVETLPRASVKAQPKAQVKAPTNASVIASRIAPAKATPIIAEPTVRNAHSNRTRIGLVISTDNRALSRATPAARNGIDCPARQTTSQDYLPYEGRYPAGF